MKTLTEQSQQAQYHCADCGNVSSETHLTQDRRPCMLPAEKVDEDCVLMGKVREAINGYYLALDQRKHGGLAQDKAFRKIEKALAMNWTSGEQLAAQAEQPA